MLVGERIILRSVRKDDLELFNQWRNNIDIKNQALLHPFPITKELDEDWFNYTANNKQNNTVFFTIESKTNDVLGYTFLSNINWVNRNAYFGIIVGEHQQRGKGLGKEALNLIIDYAFLNLNLHKISLEVVSNNVAAIKLYENLGFKKEGTLHDHAFVGGQYRNVLVMSVFKKEMLK